jgi:PAS domain S-box-containing protein
MGPSDKHDHEKARLSEIRLLDLAALQPKIDRLTRLAKTIADVPYAYVAIVEEDHAWQSAFEGQSGGIVPRELSIASMIITLDQTVFTPDARYFARHHPWVKGPPYARFFCGAPIRLRDGLAIGAFCVMSPEPREPDAALIGFIEDIADLLSDEIDSLRDQRQRARAESEAEATQRMLKSFVLSSPVALAMTDRKLRLMEVSPRWRMESGLHGEVIGRTIRELFPQAYAELRPFFRKVLAGEALSAEKLIFTRPDGVKRWIRAELSPWRDSRGEIGGMVAMTSDITDMVTSLERAERSEGRLRLALEIAGLLVYEADYRTGAFELAGAEDTFLQRPMTFEELTRDPFEPVLPEDRPAAKALWRSHLEDGRPFRTEYRMNHSDGKEVWAYAAAELVRNAEGKPERLIGVLMDITTRRQAEAALVAARDAAEAANRAKSEFLANMSHELRTPLNGIVGVASALARTGLTPAQEEMVRLIQTSGAGLETILSDVLDFSRIEAGRVELSPDSFELEDCLRSAAALFGASAREKGLDLRLEVAPEVRGVFEGDAGRIRQVLFNLLSNAVKFTDTGGVAIRAEATGETAGAVRVAVSVSDTGIGFDETLKARLFERFEQADGSITRRFGGSGLGLAISRSLAEAMGGGLEAVSEPGRGSTFTLTLPLRRAASQQTSHVALPETPPLGRNARVLLAEDHAINRRVVELILGASGVDLVCVENGHEAVEAATHGRFDLILMDIQMPQMDGLTAIRTIRALERNEQRRPTPIWALSANALPEHLEASMAAGADGHLTKPISAPALFQALAEACATVPAPQASARRA